RPKGRNRQEEAPAVPIALAPTIEIVQPILRLAGIGHPLPSYALSQLAQDGPTGRKDSTGELAPWPEQSNASLLAVLPRPGEDWREVCAVGTLAGGLEPPDLLGDRLLFDSQIRHPPLQLGQAL